LRLAKGHKNVAEEILQKKSFQRGPMSQRENEGFFMWKLTRKLCILEHVVKEKGFKKKLAQNETEKGKKS